jgi:hypothetical protein
MQMYRGYAFRVSTTFVIQSCDFVSHSEDPCSKVYSETSYKHLDILFMVYLSFFTQSK